MKYQEVLAQRELVVDDLPKSQQKKIAELEKLSEKIEEIEADIDEESREEFEAIKSQVSQADEELVSFIQTFDVEKAREQRARLAEMRSRRKPKAPEAPKEVPVVPIAAPAPEPPVKEAPVVEAPVVAPAAPVRENEQPIAQHIEELRQAEGEDYEDDEIDLCPDCAEKYFTEQQEPIEVEAEEFEKQGERAPRKVNIPLVVMGVGALLLTWGAVNFFKERR